MLPPYILRQPRASRICGIAVALLLTVSSLTGFASAQAAPSPLTTLSSVKAMQQLDRDFFDQRRGLYVVSGDKYDPGASLWPTSQILAGAISVARRTHAAGDLARVRRIITSLQRYAGADGIYRARTFIARRYTDDNNWIALDLLDAYTLLHDPSYLTVVERIFSYVVANWDPNGGGIVWGDGHTDRPTVSTAPAITIGVRLAGLTADPRYRTWADRLYNWENSHLRRPDGLYWDHIRADGSIDRDIVSYNQGVMIEANLAYAGLTHQQRYLQEARRIAQAGVASLPGPWRSLGTYAAFDAIFVQALVQVNWISPGTVRLQTAQGYAAWMWATARASLADHTEPALLQRAAMVIISAALGQ